MPRNSSQLRRDPRSEALLWLALAEIRCGEEKEILAQKYGTEQKKKRIGVGFFFQFRDDCESKRALTNFFACNEGLGDLHHQRHHHCSFSASTDFSALTSFFSSWLLWATLEFWNWREREIKVMEWLQIPWQRLLRYVCHSKLWPKQPRLVVRDSLV